MPITKEARANAAALKLIPERLDYLDAYLDAFVREGHRQAIVVKVNRYGQPIFEGAYGQNTKDYGMKMDLIFPVASITKPIVSTLLMILQEQGKLNVSEPIWRYLPEFTGGGRESICVWHLLTHSSGLKDEEVWGGADAYIEETYGLKRPEDGSPDEAWDAFHKAVREKMGLRPESEDSGRLNDPHYLISLKLPLPHKPRSHMTYCNYGYQVCKWIVEAVSGEPADQFAQRVLFHPLGMVDTYWRVPKEKWPRILGRVESARGVPWINSEDNYLNESGSGGLKTTAGDITRFLQMMLGGGTLDGVRVLSKYSTTRMVQNYNADVPGGEGPDWNAWGLGFNVRCGKMDDSGVLRPATAFDHGGWAGTKILADPESGLAIALFTAEYERPPEKDTMINGRFFNVLYSALEP